MRSFYLFMLGIFLFMACDSENNAEIPNTNYDTVTVTSNVLIPSFEGNGVQWGGYDVLEAWTGSPTLSDADWNKLFERVSFMSPSLVRIMIAPGWNYMVDGNYDPSKSEDVLFKILDYCQAHDISVIFGEWGHQGGNSVDQEWLENSASFLKYVIMEKGYSCIKYYNMVNEPNGDWSSIDGDYELWRDLMEQYYAKLTDKGLESEVELIGPDVAVWGTDLVPWVSNTVTYMDDKMGAYDIHTYPSEKDVRGGTYQDMVAAYRNAAPQDKPMVMGEVGFKYPADSELGKENARRIEDDPYASDDSNMFIYDSFYGIDMSDVVIQNMLAGYAGVIIWGLDDAQYNIDGGSSTELKKWGFWNILGEENFGGAEEEKIRPWFYPMSLLSKYFPKGTKIYDIELPNKKGLRAIAGEKDGDYTVAFVNAHYGDYTVELDVANKEVLSALKKFKYIEGEGSSFEGPTNDQGFAVPTNTDVSFSFEDDDLQPVELPGRSFLLFTNMDQ